jgi:hypothetical protein
MRTAPSCGQWMIMLVNCYQPYQPRRVLWPKWLS